MRLHASCGTMHGLQLTVEVRAHLHALADLLHLAGARDRLGALVRLLQLALLVPDAPQQALHRHITWIIARMPLPSMAHGLCLTSWDMQRSLARQAHAGTGAWPHAPDRYQVMECT